MPHASTLLLFVGASVVLLAIPGPAVIYVVTRSLGQGRAAGLVSVLGVETGTFTYALAAAAGLSGLIAASQTAFIAIKFEGAAYLIYLGVRKLLESELAPPPAASGRRRLYWNGLLLQLLNPKIAIFFVAFLPQFVDRAHGAVAPQMLVLGATFTVLALLSDGAYALAAGTIGGRLRTSRAARSALAKVSGGVYVGLGIAAALAGGSSARSSHG
jgi:threonine/homoserine/homoserine lactone efflux protein